MGRLREKLDDDLPELTEGLVSLLWPHYLRTIPSMSVVEFTPDWREMKEPMRIVKGFEVSSRPIGEKGTRCRYSTTKEITLQPLSLDHVRLSTDPDGRSVISLRFNCSALADWTRIDLSLVPFYFNADAPLACAMHEAFTMNVARLWLRLPGEVDRSALDGHFTALGFGEHDDLWPKGSSSFSGYQLLLEYFTFREKFMFTGLRGLESVAFPAELLWFEIDVVLAERWEHDFSFTEKHLRLNCVPVINLFPLESDPLTLNALQTEYLLRPMRVQDGHTEIFAVDSVMSSSQHTYVPFSSFRHKGGMMRHDAPEYYYHTRVRRGPSGLHNTWLILGGEAFDNHTVPEDESLSLTLTGTNGQLPRRALQSTVLDTVMKTTSTRIAVRNLCAPTLPCYPPAQDRFHWRVLSHLGSGFLSMMDNADVLRGNALSQSVVLRIYQLKDIKTFDSSVYQQLLNEGETTLGGDLLATRDVVLKPGGDVSLNMAMEDDAKYVAVAGLFRDPDTVKNTWKLTIDREALDPDEARVIEAGSHYLKLLPPKDD